MPAVDTTFGHGGRSDPFMTSFLAAFPLRSGRGRSPLAASFLGGALIIILGLVLLKDAAAPLAAQPWFRELLEGTGDSLALAFLAAALLTFIVQSSSAVTVFGISLAAVSVLSVDQTIMNMYGSLIGSGAILYVLSTGLVGRSRQVAMYLVGYNVLICAVLVPLLYFEIHSGVPLVKASALSLGLGLDQQLTAVYVFLCLFLLPVMLAGLGWSASVLERLWPSSPADALARPQYIHDHASVDVETSVVLVDLEQRRAIRDLSEYFGAVRRGERIEPLRAATRKLLSDVTEFLDDLHTLHPMHGVEDQNSLRNRQKLVVWLEDALRNGAGFRLRGLRFARVPGFPQRREEGRHPRPPFGPCSRAATAPSTTARPRQHGQRQAEPRPRQASRSAGR